jgi:hypothetical protein
MTAVSIFPDLTQAAPEFDRSKAIEVREGISFGRMPMGTANGNATVMVFVPLPDGRTVVAEVTLNNFNGVAAAFRGAEERNANQ